jgi:hypothetical protein
VNKNMEVTKIEYDKIEISLKFTKKEFETFKAMIHDFPHSGDGSILANNIWKEIKHI